jgi:hypothetical protein
MGNLMGKGGDNWKVTTSSRGLVTTTITGY